MIVPALIGFGLLAALSGQTAAVLIAGTGVVAILFFALFYLSARLLQFLFLIVDQDAGIIESLQRSWALTRGKAGTVMVVYLAQFAVFLGGIVAFCFGAILAWPLGSLLRAVMYLALVGSTRKQEPIVYLE